MDKGTFLGYDQLSISVSIWIVDCLSLSTSQSWMWILASRSPLWLKSGHVRHNPSLCKELDGWSVPPANARGDHGDFLRGATSSSQNGIAEFQTIFPGWSDGDGANHVNIAVHSTSDISSPTIHVGKLYFTDRWTDLIGKTSPYNENSNSRILNEDDPDFKDALAEGYSPVISWVIPKPS